VISYNKNVSSFSDLTYRRAAPSFVLAGKEFWRLRPSRKGVALVAVGQDGPKKPRRCRMCWGILVGRRALKSFCRVQAAINMDSTVHVKDDRWWNETLIFREPFVIPFVLPYSSIVSLFAYSFRLSEQQPIVRKLRLRTTLAPTVSARTFSRPSTECFDL
jgi:hypothetical protein